MSQTQTPTTADKLKILLDILNIKVVYYVDDENHLTDFDVQVVTGEISKIYGLNKEEQLKSIQIEELDWEMPPEGVLENIKEQWATLSFEKKQTLYSDVLKISGGEDIKLDFERAVRIGEQIPEGLIKIMSPQEWDEEKGKLAGNIGEGEMALVLFDEDLKHAGAEYSTIRGQDLIVQVKKMGVNDKVICSLLTHKIPSLKDEFTFRDTIIKERAGNDLEVNDFFPLAKERLDTPEVFADGIKKALLNKYFESIKKHTIDLVKYSYGKAAEMIDSFDTYDFDDTILKTSLKEGVWEPETIIRISDILFENELKKRMVETDYVPKVNIDLKASQKFSEIQFDVPGNIQPYSDKLTIRHHEIYDPNEIINALRKPLENGDIFQIGNNKFILVAQPCDMMVRAKDAKKGLRNAKVATLLRIEEKEFSKNKLKEIVESADKFPLVYYVRGTKNLGIVQFSSFLIVDVDLLDLCVFNENGDSKIDMANPIVDTDYLSIGWEARFDILLKKLSVIQSKISEVKNLLQGLQPEQAQSILSQFYPKLIIASSIEDFSHSCAVNAEISNFDFFVKRCLHFKIPGSNNLLEKYTAYLSRKAEPHDFARDEPVTQNQTKGAQQNKGGNKQKVVIDVPKQANDSPGQTDNSG